MEFCGGRKFRSKVKPARNFDVCYDSTLSFPSVKDYNRAMAKAVAAATQFLIQPRFQTMFSDTRPRISRKSRCIMPISSPSDDFPIISGEIALSGHAMNARRSIFFKQPVVRTKVSKTLHMELAENFQLHVQQPKVLNKSIQTDYRDSETQTDAWAHDVIATHGAAVLQLTWLHIDSFTTPGFAEITQIQRFWQRQAWEAVVPKMELVCRVQRVAMTNALAENDTATKDGDVDEENRMRLWMVADKLVDKFSEQRENLGQRLERFALRLRDGKSETVSYLKHKLCRDLRKLGMKHRGVEFKYKSRFFRDVLTEITDKASNLNAPLIRFGDDLLSKREIGEIRCRHLTDIDGLEVLEKRVVYSGGVVSGVKSFMRPRNPSCKRRMVNLEKELAADCVEEVSKETCGVLKKREVLETRFRLPYETLDWSEDDRKFQTILGKCIQGRSVKKQLSDYYFVQG